VLLICAIVAGLSGGFAARYRRWGTGLADLAIGFTVAGLFSIVSGVVLIVTAGLDVFGIIHYAYLLIVVAFPVGVAWIVLPQLVDAERRTPFLGWLLAISAVAAVLVGLWGTHVEPYRLQVERHVLGATGAEAPIIVGVIADLQTTSIGSHENAALDQVLAGRPDVVVLPGDLFQLELDDLSAQLPQFRGWLRRLTDSVEHVVIVNGNVDFADVVEELAEETGATYLDDRLISLAVNDQQVTFVGLSVDPDREASATAPDLAEMVAETTRENDLVVAVSHYPDPILELPPDTTVDLLIAGHTHGGQVALPGIGPLVTFSDVPKVVAAGGLHVVDGTPIYVSTGVGLERGQAPQLRFGAPPSVALLTIVPA